METIKNPQDEGHGYPPLAIEGMITIQHPTNVRA